MERLTLGCAVDDASQKYGHFGSYVSQGRYYHFVLLSEEKDQLLWEVHQNARSVFTERAYGAQFLLYWFKDSGFSLDWTVDSSGFMDWYCNIE